MNCFTLYGYGTDHIYKKSKTDLFNSSHDKAQETKSSENFYQKNAKILSLVL